MHFDIYKSQEYQIPKLIFIHNQNYTVKIYFIYFHLEVQF